MGKTLLLTGIPQIGKTTLIKKAVQVLGDRAGGFYTEEIFGPGGRKGFRLITLDGQTITLAHKDFRGPHVPRVGRYGVDVANLERVGIPAIRRAIEKQQVVIIDEIGKLELFSTAFCNTTMEAILSRSVVLGSIIAKPDPRADLFKTLAQVTLWTVELRNRDALHTQIHAWLGNALGQL